MDTYVNQEADSLIISLTRLPIRSERDAFRRLGFTTPSPLLKLLLHDILYYLP